MRSQSYSHLSLENLAARLLKDGLSGLSPLLKANSSRNSLRSPDVFEDDLSYYLLFELPGVARERVSLTSEKDTVHLRVHAAGETDTENAKPESATAFRAPKDADISRIGAKLENGILTVSLPKREEALPRTIQIS